MARLVPRAELVPARRRLPGPAGRPPARPAGPRHERLRDLAVPVQALRGGPAAHAAPAELVRPRTRCSTCPPASCARPSARGGRRCLFRAAGSAGGRFPLELYVSAPDGVHWYDPEAHALVRIAPPAGGEATTLIVTGVPWRTAWRYAERGFRHLYWDAGTMLAQTLALAPEGRLITRFPDARVSELVGADGTHEFPLALVALGDGAPRDRADRRGGAAAPSTRPARAPADHGRAAGGRRRRSSGRRGRCEHAPVDDDRDPPARLHAPDGPGAHDPARGVRAHLQPRAARRAPSALRRRPRRRGRRARHLPLARRAADRATCARSCSGCAGTSRSGGPRRSWSWARWTSTPSTIAATARRNSRRESWRAGCTWRPTRSGSGRPA